MNTWQALRRSTTMALAGAVVAFGLSLASSPASAQETIACVGNKTGLVRIVDDESQCKFWEHAQTIGGGDGSGVKFVFVTSESYSGDLVTEATSLGFGGGTGPEAGDFLCNRLAGEANLPGTYVAWLSTASVDARDRLPLDGGPWFNVKGQLVAASLSALLNADNVELYNGITYTDLGEDTSHSVWTATTVTGVHVPPNDCSSWTSTAGSGRVGLTNSTDENWTDEGGDDGCSNAGVRLYCFQE